MVLARLFLMAGTTGVLMSHLLLDLPLHTTGQGLDMAWLAGHALMLWTLSAAATLWRYRRRHLA